ncbi:hypothetical protein C2845_PM05G24360 [Panicum miliaceum]|uniref:Uncharacterized protein n=1 Tax=Panicum miliaceum TaxID=4540 RepID=A0A3L6T532_PANMI|nr:hypothetical protein C2845_PM05G24360 [Panicum miliaceum]
MQQIKNMLEEKDVIQKELEDFKTTAQAIVEMVEFPAEGDAGELSLLEKPRATPQKVASYISEATRMYIAQALALVKPYWPKAKLQSLTEGMAVNCSVEQFTKFREEVEPLADKIAESLEQDG